jgi:hypothetical protein
MTPSRRLTSSRHRRGSACINWHSRTVARYRKHSCLWQEGLLGLRDGTSDALDARLRAPVFLSPPNLRDDTPLRIPSRTPSPWLLIRWPKLVKHSEKAVWPLETRIPCVPSPPAAHRQSREQLYDLQPGKCVLALWKMPHCG